MTSYDTDMLDIGSDDENEEITSAEMIQKLEEIWLNEKFSPELLKFQEDIIQCVIEQIKQMEKNLQKSKNMDLRSIVHKMELDRIRYMLSSYLRERLRKIEMYTASIVKLASDNSDNSEENLLSSAEKKFAKEHLASLENHFNQVAVDNMPSNFQSLELEKNMPKPDLDKYVFLTVNQDFQVDDDEDVTRDEDIIEFEKGDQHLIRYKPIASHLKQGSVSLI